MSLKKITFQRDKQFYQVLRDRVSEYFESRHLSTHANAEMIFKSVTLLTITYGAYALLMMHTLPIWTMLLLCVLMGMGVAGIGFSVAHDAIHGAYSANPKVNYVLGLTMNMIGGNRYVWSITHNIIHHTYTNIAEVDEDLEIAPFIRLSKHIERKPIHRVQHVLAFVAYAFATIFWVFLKDFKKVLQRDLGPYKNKKHPASEIVLMIIFKAIFYSYMIVLPLFIFPWYEWLVGFLIVELTAGIILGIVFQMAHTVEGPEHVLEGEGNMEDSWAVHQMKTTSNFAMKNRFINWYVGGLNFQVEHHLFPQVCSVHYPAISKIVHETADEYHVPYLYHETFFGAIASHYRMLKFLGQPDKKVEVAAAAA